MVRRQSTGPLKAKTPPRANIVRPASLGATVAKSVVEVAAQDGPPDFVIPSNLPFERITVFLDTSEDTDNLKIEDHPGEEQLSPTERLKEAIALFVWNKKMARLGSNAHRFGAVYASGDDVNILEEPDMDPSAMLTVIDGQTVNKQMTDVEAVVERFANTDHVKALMKGTNETDYIARLILVLTRSTIPILFTENLVIKQVLRHPQTIVDVLYVNDGASHCLQTNRDNLQPIADADGLFLDLSPGDKGPLGAELLTRAFAQLLRHPSLRDAAEKPALFAPDVPKADFEVMVDDFPALVTAAATPVPRHSASWGKPADTSKATTPLIPTAIGPAAALKRGHVDDVAVPPQEDPFVIQESDDDEENEIEIKPHGKAWGRESQAWSAAENFPGVSFGHGAFGRESFPLPPSSAYDDPPPPYPSQTIPDQTIPDQTIPDQSVRDLEQRFDEVTMKGEDPSVDSEDLASGPPPGFFCNGGQPVTMLLQSTASWGSSYPATGHLPAQFEDPPPDTFPIPAEGSVGFDVDVEMEPLEPRMSLKETQERDDHYLASTLVMAEAPASTGWAAVARKMAEPRCTNCDHAGHWAVDCIQKVSQLQARKSRAAATDSPNGKCNYCSKVGHTRLYCPQKVERAKEITCCVCKQYGVHESRDCPDIAEYNCELCNVRGHCRYNCPNRCQYCKKSDHVQRNCRELAVKDWRRGQAKDACRVCLKTGHAVEACPEKNTSVCYLCKMLGHHRATCLTHCSFCQLAGHVFTQCPERPARPAKSRTSRHTNSSQSGSESPVTVAWPALPPSAEPLPRCGKCTRLGHATEQCEQKSCENCSDPFHIKGRCQRNRVCSHCHIPGHAKADCPTKAEARKTTPSSRVVEPTPTPTPPTSATSATAANACNYCHAVGHFVRNCKELAEKEAVSKCLKCGERGHIGRNCPGVPPSSLKRGGQRGSRGAPTGPCLLCRATGHWKSECPNKLVCHTCLNPGHVTRNCPAVTCNYCRGHGHRANDCPKGRMDHKGK